MRVIVCGSRSWNDERAIRSRLAQLPTGTTIVHGGASGADRIASEQAYLFDYAVEAHHADWRLGKKAGFLRNVEMAKAGADLCLAFWDGSSKGTANMIGVARGFSIPVEIIEG